MVKTAWQQVLSTIITDPAILLEKLALDSALLPAAKKAAGLFPLKAPESFVARMEKGNPRDPLLLQVLPLAPELHDHPGFVPDPLGEKNANPVSGLLHKYHGRVLMTLTGACAVHCRYCFRRHFPYGDNNPGRKGWQQIYDYLQTDPSIEEVILSGGDPLSAGDSLLKQFTDGLQTVPHIKRLRIHTRLPIVIPERITGELVSWLQALPYEIVIVLHVNHANEINTAVKDALAKVKPHAHLLNQSVLLKCVNDSAEALTDLSYRLFEAGVLPYYLHLLDKVKGAHHYEVAHERALGIYRAIQLKLPGYLVPKLAMEEAGEGSKTLVTL